MLLRLEADGVIFDPGKKFAGQRSGFYALGVGDLNLSSGVVFTRSADLLASSS
jgi:hypothetical protein